MLLSAVIFITAGLNYVHAQTPEQNLEKYWKYRDRFKKNFINIGKAKGQSIPMSARNIGFTYYDDPNNQNGSKSRLYFLDATIYLGHYLVMLSTEHKMLKDELAANSSLEDPSGALDQHYQSNLNELYYALNAINRLDDNAEEYLRQDEFWPVQRNGIMLRDDVDQAFIQPFLNDYSDVFQRDCNFQHSNSDYWSIAPFDNTSEGTSGGEIREFNRRNVYSIDQVSSLLHGLRYVYRLVGELSVQPTASDQSINIRQEARNIALRIINQIVHEASEINGYSFETRNYDGLKTLDGGSGLFFAPMLISYAFEFHHPQFINMSWDEIDDINVAIQIDPRNADPCDLNWSSVDGLDGVVQIASDIAEFGCEYAGCGVFIQDLAQEMEESGDLITVGKIKLGVLRGIWNSAIMNDLDISTWQTKGIPIPLAMNINLAFNSINWDIEFMSCDNLNPLAYVARKYAVKFLVRMQFLLLFTHIVDLASPNTDIEIQLNSTKLRDKIDDDNVHMMLEFLVGSNYIINFGSFPFGADQSTAPYLAANTPYLLPPYLDPIQTGLINLGFMNYCLHPVTGYQAIGYIDKLCYENGFEWYAMSNRVLNTGSITPTLPIGDRVINELNNAPCEGPWDSFSRIIDGSIEPRPFINNWLASNKLFHPSNSHLGIPNREFRGEYSGIDYMVMYNLSRLAFSSQGLPSFRPNFSCNCVSEFTHIDYTDATLLVDKKFEQYKRQEIVSPSILAHDLTVDGSLGNLSVKNDLIVCGPDPSVPTTLEVKNNARLNIYGGMQIIVKAGNRLRITENAKIVAGIGDSNFPELGSASTILLEENAVLELTENADIDIVGSFQINMLDGAQLIINNSVVDVSTLTGTSGIRTFGENTIISINSSSLRNLNPAQKFVIESTNSCNVDIKGSQIQLLNGGFSLKNSVLSALNSYIQCEQSGYVMENCQISLNNTPLQLKSQGLSIRNASAVELRNSNITLNQAQLELLGASLGPSVRPTMLADQSNIFFNGSDSRFILNFATLTVAENFQMTISSLMGQVESSKL